jgi:hypothetical protein
MELSCRSFPSADLTDSTRIFHRVYSELLSVCVEDSAGHSMCNYRGVLHVFYLHLHSKLFNNVSSVYVNFYLRVAVISKD